MKFLSPIWLTLLGGVAVLAGLYVASQFRRKAYAVRFTNLDLLDKIAPDRPNWRRHVPAVVMLLGLIGLVFGLARPARELPIAKERATIIVALDTSNSMMATDVSPTRLDAAKDAATEFVHNLPASLNVGLVEFHGSAAMLVPPTKDHGDVERAIANLELAPAPLLVKRFSLGYPPSKPFPPRRKVRNQLLPALC